MLHHDFRLALIVLLACSFFTPAEARKINLGVKPGLHFEPKILHVLPGEDVELTFDNTDLMMHNFVLVEPGARMEIVEAANALGEKGPGLHYVPDSAKVLASTPVVLPKKKSTIRFKAPVTEGKYPYVCTFPGHGFLMHGTLFVAKNEPKELAAGPTKNAGSPVGVPEELESTLFSPKTVTPCVACIGVAPTGEVYAGVDQIGSLGKGGGKGRIIRLVDKDHDGVSDYRTEYALIDNPRGIVPVGDKLYVLHAKWGKGTQFDGMFLSVLEDKDGDGMADGPPKHLVKEISTRKFNQSRGVDHTTNGIRMGIDGWIYVAVGDFGFVDAEGTDGTKLTMYGGGIIRVRPDGTELETYADGLRNIYDVAIDPFMNVFTRGNTNDGGGWNMRFIHEIQTGEYGYPELFKRYTSEIIPALVDVGGGSGTGAMFFDEPGWPDKYNDVPMMCDWGRGQLFIHRVTPDGASFTQNQESFIKCGRITDVDCDASGRLFIGSWGNSGFKGGTDGYVARVVPKGWKYKEFPDLRKRSEADLANMLTTPSAKTRLHAQQEILRRGGEGREVLAVAMNKKLTPRTRVAAIFTLKQLLGTKSHKDLLKLVDDPAVTEHALRALADRRTEVEGIPQAPFAKALKSTNPRVQVAAAVALGRLGEKSAAKALLAVSSPPATDPLPVFKAPAAVDSGPQGVHQSPLIDGKKTHSFDVDVSGWKELYLMIGDGDNGDGNDHGAWFEPTLVKKDGSVIRLTDLKWSQATQGWGKTGAGISATGAKLVRSDKKAMAFGIGSHAVSVISYKNLPPEITRFKCVAGLADTHGGGRVRFYVSNKVTKKFAGGGKKEVVEGPHATPNPASILPHVARKALVALQAGLACVDAIGTPHQSGALMALRYMHHTETVDALLKRFEKTSTSETKQRIARSLVRLANKEKLYQGDTWWGTRPDTRGPYYYPTPWEKTEEIHQALVKAAETGDSATRFAISELAEKDRVSIPGLPKGD